MPSEPRGQNADTDVADRATPVEIFFDVVFVLTVTQLAGLLEHHLNWAGVGQTVLILGLLWYVYSGYVWLTNHVPPRRPVRILLLFGGMAGFLLTAAAIPHAFTGSGLLFGVGYLIVVTVHIGLFSRSPHRPAVRRFVPYELGGAALVIVAGLLTGPAVPVLWVAAIFIQSVLPFLLPGHSWVGAAASLHVRPAHFVERHALLVIVALGETVVAIGMGARVDHLNPGVAGAVVMALALPATFWWTYFTDTAASEAALEHADDATRARLAARVYNLDHVVLLLGIIATATGLHAVVVHPETPAGWPAALALTAGVALFLAAIADLRHSVGVRRTTSRRATAALVLASTPIGASVNSALHLGVVIILMLVMLLIDGHRPGAPLSRAVPA
ncbi:low temperature requirement protein A [Micromonospora sp. URMC 103]|uniref:low temperature requirement protein A n=1 Tax=Micromonospora sp. URMC 103 TaxID=3423406 RepID=UPI003F1AB9E3